MATFTPKEAKLLLKRADLLLDRDFDSDPKEWNQTLNMSDVWGWGTADCEYVADEDLPRVAELFYRYGWCGILYWVSKKRGDWRSEFHDNNRFIDFVHQEEAIREEEPDYNKRAYLKKQYTIGVSA